MNRKIVNKSVIVNEIVEAIKKQKNGKTLEQDGFPAEYYKAFEDVLLLPYKQALENIERKSKMPPSWREATISLIHEIYI